MSEVLKYKLDSILGGISPWFYDSTKGSYQQGLGIDPDWPVAANTEVTRLGGAITPTTYNTFSSTLIDDIVLEFINCPQNELTYAVLRSGKVISYNSSLTTLSETSVGTVSGYGYNFANALPFALGGVAYYNNYIYFFGTGLGLKYKTLTGTFSPGLTVTGATSHATGVIIETTGFRINYTNSTGAFTVGLVVSGATSHAVGTIISDTSSGTIGTLTLSSVSGTFTNGEVLTDTSTGSAHAGATSGTSGTLLLKTISGVFQNNEALRDTSTGVAVVDGTLIASGSDVTRYGPLNGTPAFTENWWTDLFTPGTGVGLSQTTYPLLYGAYTPNHWAHYHAPDDTLYFCDFSTAAGRGLIHKIVTTNTTYPGDTDNGSAYGVLQLPFGIYPVDIEDYGADLAIATTRTTSQTVIQGKAEIYFWDTFSDTYYNVTKLPDVFATALFNNDGELYVFSGSAGGGSRLSYYSGGRSTTQLCFIEESVPPFQGAVASYGDRILFGGNMLVPEIASCVYAWGSKDIRMKSVLHSVMRTRAGTSVPFTSAIRFVQQQSGTYPRMLVAWSNSSAWGIDKMGAPAALNSSWRSPVFQVGSKFVIREIRIPLGAAVGTGCSIVPTVLVDDFQGTTFTLDTINPTNFNGKKKAIYKNPKMDDTNPITGDHNFALNLKWTGAAGTSVVFPIEIVVEVYEDEPTR